MWRQSACPGSRYGLDSRNVVIRGQCPRRVTVNLKPAEPPSIPGKRRRKLVTSVCVGALVLPAVLVSIASLALADTRAFPDVPSTHPYYTAITDLASWSIIGGYPNGNFGPGNAVTRQQFAKMIVLTGGYPVSESDVCPFADVDKSNAASLYPDNYVAVAAAHQITNGTDATHFSPTKHITGYQAISMAVRMADDVQPGLLATPPADWVGNVTWANNAAHRATAARAEYNGLLAGLDLSDWSPSEDMNRGEVAQVLYNLLGKLRSTTSSSAPNTTEATTTTTSSTTTTTSSTTPTTNPAFANLGGVITSAPAACSQTFGLLDVFARGTDGALMHKSWDGTVWSAWEDLGGVMKSGSDLAATSPREALLVLAPLAGAPLDMVGCLSVARGSDLEKALRTAPVAELAELVSAASAVSFPLADRLTELAGGREAIFARLLEEQPWAIDLGVFERDEIMVAKGRLLLVAVHSERSTDRSGPSPFCSVTLTVFEHSRARFVHAGDPLK